MDTAMKTWLVVLFTLSVTSVVIAYGVVVPVLDQVSHIVRALAGALSGAS